MSPSEPDEVTLRIAWLGSTPTNLYDDAILRGSSDAALASTEGHFEVVPFYSNFDPEAQLSQCLELLDSGDYTALVLMPASSVGLIPCVEHAAELDVPVVVTDLHLGEDPTTSEVQVLGQTAAVVVPPAAVGLEFADVAVERCADINPCEIVFIAGLFSLVNDKLALTALEQAAEANANIELIAVGEGYYDTAVAESFTADLLAGGATPDLILHGGDQMAMGSELAIADAGLEPGSVDLVGGGGGVYGVEAVADGRWYATFVTLPYDEGQIATEVAMRAILDLPIDDTGVNPMLERGLPYMLTQDNISAAYAGFEPQWPG